MSRRSIRNCNKGATLVELLVASTIGVLLVSLTHGVVLSNQRLYQYDLLRTELTQNLRSALDIIAGNAREAGERLPSGFPALEVVDGGGAVPDELVIRRNLLDEVLVVCSSISAGSTNTTIYASSSSATIPACVYPSQMTQWSTWGTYRGDNGGTVNAYVYNQSTRLGEFVTYISENNGADLSITKAAGSWTNDYPAQNSAVYMLSEWRYRINGEYLEVIRDDDDANPLLIVYGIENFQVKVEMQDGT
ncbi:MAG: hypothetical protein KDD44_12815, partial [Bdellovibrionales bacterium]|nr:hypothetical protein [Bdellovibrionales bacterium]